MSKLTFALLAGSFALALTGAAQAKSKVHVSNRTAVVSVPANSNVRADASPRLVQPTTTSTYFGSWNGAGPGIRY